MLQWALVFFVIALFAGMLSFSGVALISAGLAKLLFFLFLAVFLVTLVLGVTRRA